MKDRQAMTLSRLSPSSKLVCIRGTTWITMAGDHADYFVREGERFSTGGRKLVISAIGPTEFYILAHKRRSVPLGVRLQRQRIGAL
jgi:hypothetical protein